MIKQGVKSRKYKGEPFLFRIDKGLKEQFTQLIQIYDPEMSFNSAIKKLIQHAIVENWLPGYIPKNTNLVTFQNKQVEVMDRLKPAKAVLKP